MLLFNVGKKALVFQCGVNKQQDWWCPGAQSCYRRHIATINALNKIHRLKNGPVSSTMVLGRWKYGILYKNTK